MSVILLPRPLTYSAIRHEIPHVFGGLHASGAAEQKSGVSSHSADELDPVTLASLSEIEQESVAALRMVGALVRFANAGPMVDKNKIVIIVGKNWSGDDHDLERALDLSTLGALYVFGSERVTDESLDKLRKLRPEVDIQRGPEVWFGISARAHPKGLEIKSIFPGSPADRAGILKNDVLLEFAGQPVPSIEAWPPLMLPLKPGQKVNATLLRDGETHEVIVDLDERHY